MTASRLAPALEVAILGVEGSYYFLLAENRGALMWLNYTKVY